jgi:copper chaperone NosL
MKIKYAITFSAILLLAGCSGENGKNSIPAPTALTEEAAGHYCQMVILDHVGPKTQVHLVNNPNPVWFSQVRDGLAYLKSPEKTAQTRVIYVNDIGASISWSDMGENNWIDAKKAFFVIGSDALGGMGIPEFVPFADEIKAQDFAKTRGGEVMSFDDISSEMVLAPVDYPTPPTTH